MDAAEEFDWSTHAESDVESDASPETPFDTLESAHEYVNLLREEVDRTISAVDDDVAMLRLAAADRRVNAFHLVDYKLRQLREHLAVSSRLLNDLRTLRRLLHGERPDASR